MFDAQGGSLALKPKIKWSENQTKSISREYPFDLNHETEEQFIVRTYLQFLWLPESIMPVKFLVPSLMRVTGASCPKEPHPLHEYLRSLLQTTKSISNKYHTELPTILRDGGGAGEIEETMMWYVLNHEKADDLWDKTTDGPWEDTNWRLQWIERMERREVLIQILLYFTKLSLPPPPNSSPKKRKRVKSSEEARLDDETALEGLFDKLSMWQLMLDVDGTVGPKASEKQDQQHDWMQKFFSEVISPHFHSNLPELCSLFHSKIFPSSDYASSNPSSPSSSRATTPDVTESLTTDLTRKKSARQVSPALSTTSTSSRQPQRARSLSISLAQERALQRERSIGPSGPKKRMLNREVSMSRVFKPKIKPPGQQATDGENTNTTRVDVKRKSVKQDTKQNPAAKKERDVGVTLVEATPVKARPARAQSRTQSQLKLQDVFAGQRNMERASSVSSILSFGRPEGFGDEAEWQLSSSPDLMSIYSGGIGEEELTDVDDDDGDAGSILLDSTPTKRKRIR